MDRIETFTVFTLGCSKNVVDSENLIGLLKTNHLKFTTDLKQAHAVLVNTCGFVNDSKTESLQMILELESLRKNRKIKKLIVFGCLSERYAQDLHRQLKFVDHIFGVNSINEINEVLTGRNLVSAGRELLTPSHYAYLKISEGCDHRCAFCAIPLIRGRHKSRYMEDIVEEAKQLVDRGVKELNVIAQDTTFYGKDIYGKQNIAELASHLSDIKGLDWIRFLYAYPVAFPMDLIDVMAERDNICKYIDIPFQHINDEVLKTMGRGINKAKTYELIDSIRKTIPDIALRSTFIVGYPTETEERFEELMQFVSDVKLDRAGVFMYSREEDTPAHQLEDPVPYEVKVERMDKLMRLQQKISLEKNLAKVGNTYKVMIDEYNRGAYVGRTQFDAPEVDNSVIVKKSKGLPIGSFANIKITKAEEYDIYGEVCISQNWG